MILNIAERFKEADLEVTTNSKREVESVRLVYGFGREFNYTADGKSFYRFCLFPIKKRYFSWTRVDQYTEARKTIAGGLKVKRRLGDSSFLSPKRTATLSRGEYKTFKTYLEYSLDKTII